MPARTRAVRAPKAPKENVDILAKSKAKNVGKSTKAVRKPLADKTNSVSDENASPEPIKKVIKKSNKPSQKIFPVVSEEDRPRRNRRLPPRYVENEVLTNLSNSKANALIPNKSPHKTPVKGTANVGSPFTTPTSVLDNSLIANRPKRLSRLTSKFEDNSVSPNKFLPTHCHTKKNLKANSSFRVFENKKSKSSENQDIYEFTFDPTEEPPPQKKKKKKVTAKKPTKPRSRVFKNNYEKNIAKALADLKNVVSKHKPEDGKVTKTSKPTNSPILNPAGYQTTVSAPNPSSIVISTVAEIHRDPGQNASTRSNVSTKNHVSYRVEDIAADFDASMDHHEINYSPVNSPHRIETELEICPTSPDQAQPDDPLNLRNDLSFFDELPVANSSMNASKNPMGTPWRVEFENLPIKWQANTHVKPDMTPALECSFVNNFDDSKKKHVYTNMVAPSNDALPEIEENVAPKLKQTSLISFIKEVIDKSASKKKRGASTTPIKANFLFDMPNVITRSVATPRKETSNDSDDNESSEITKAQKHKNNVDNNPTPVKLPRKDKENTLFGFDDSENHENVSPVKIVPNNRLLSLRSRSGAVLKELNKQIGPMRAELPVAIKAKLAPSSDAVEKIYNQIKSAADAPVVLDRQRDAQATNVADTADGMEDDSQSVHLFEDIELVHHLKPTRKSYGKAKKVTFQNSSGSASGDEAARNQSSDDEADNLEDLSFHLPEFKTKKATKKKKTKKQTLSKKEKAEVDAWAACFNSMCEGIEEFDLVVE